MSTTYLFPSTLRGLADVSVSPGAGQDSYPLVWNNTTAKWEANSLISLTGIKYPASQTNSSDPNTLDDYEEATFIPRLVDFDSSVGYRTDGWSFDYQTGFYTKIGNRCFLDMFIGLTAKPGTSRNSNIVYVTTPFLASSNWFALGQTQPSGVSSYAGSWSIGNFAPRVADLYGWVYLASSLQTGVSLATVADIGSGARFTFKAAYFTN